MLKIVHALNIKKILKFYAKTKSPCSFIIPDNALKKYSGILKHNGLKEIEVTEIDDEEKIFCEKEYINNIANLSLHYHSAEWWANPVSEKNEHISSHYKNLCFFYSLIKTLQRYFTSGMSVFVLCNREIFEPLKVYCYQNSIKITSLENPFIFRMRGSYEKVFFALKIIVFLIKTFARKIYVTHELKYKIREEIDNKKDYYVIRTWLDGRFLTTGADYQDAYFGKLPGYAIKNGYNVLLLAGILNNYREIINKTKVTNNILIVPEEYFLDYSDFFRLLGYITRERIKLRQKIFFNGIDVTALYKREIEKGCFNIVYAQNILRYFIARRFAQSVNFKTYIHTYENYAWEKMTILGIREIKPEGKLLAFQHAFISRNSFKYFFGKAEKNITPLPDKIITMGRVTKEILEKYGDYSPEMLKIGSALRQEYIGSLTPLKRRLFNKIIVPLTMVRNESVLIMNFLYDSGLPQRNIKVLIRCHPAAPFESFRKNINFELPDNFIISNEKSVNEELTTTDMVLYTWTTVAVEAIKLGLPVIYLDILAPMYVDPLFECNALKRTVKKPDELLPVIENFYNMDDELFYKEHKVAQEYLKEYFYPVTRENLSPFFA